MSTFHAAVLPRRLVEACLVLLLVSGCGGGDTYSVETGQVAQRFLPSVRTVDHHPDSVRVLTITEEEGTLQYQLEQNFASLTQKWSASFQRVGTGRSIRSKTYATFWSLELSLVSLQPETGLLSLQKERARELIEKRRKEYYDTIQIDVYWFVNEGGDGIITGPGTRTELQVGDKRLRPLRSDHSPLREAFVADAGVALYRRNTIHFPRTVDGTDILENAAGMRLTVRRAGGGSREQFEWRWDTEDR